ncbi:hypothetical protein [uncultured Paludibaculum sp.]|uniref:hypothetical protein n=1 Tax=uncultured Paludibaculum sp. TaxID=1765020 RepID=UPI002AABBE17|nr:hypothetical protein [uncultured Paludibaculum sp.]
MDSRRHALSALILCALAACGPATAQSWSRFRNVTGWAGTYSVHASAKGSAPYLGFIYTWDITHSGQGTIRLTRWDPELQGWVGTIDGTAAVDEKYTEYNPGTGCTGTTTNKGGGSIATTFDGAPREFYLYLNDDGTYNIFPVDSTVAGIGSVTICGTPFFSIQSYYPWGPPGRMFQEKLPATGLALQGTKSIAGPFPGPLTGTTAPPFNYEVTWDLQPLGAEDVELTFEPLDYHDWIPEGSRSERQWGNSIKVKANLQKKGGGTPKARAVKFLFNVDASTVPGVAMNFPVKDASRRPDLAFAQDLNPEHSVSSQGLHAETPGDGLIAEAVVASYDWGAWGTIRVSALLDDGRTITGTYKDATFARLPRRSSDSKIADAWKEQTGFGGADDEDNDEQPAGDGHNGDGLTLYEEYRGFYENGDHIRTRPDRKDLFVLDKIGARAKPAIALFSQLTGLAVHHRLKADELLVYPEPHVININHESAPHLVDQHGVVLMETAETPFPQAWSKTYTDIGTPKTVDLVVIPPTLPNSIGKGPIDYLHKAIAHELMHSVGVWHHGESDGKQDWRLKLQPGATTPVLWERYTGTFLHVIKETGEDVAAEIAAKMDALFTDPSAVPADMITSYRQDIQSETGFSFLASPLVGEKGGQHSGNDDCLMRYEYAVLAPTTDSSTFYFLEDQRRGRQLCDSPVGTGNNDAGRQPQSRHGDASPNRGACRQMVCVNDAHDHPAR